MADTRPYRKLGPGLWYKGTQPSARGRDRQDTKNLIHLNAAKARQILIAHGYKVSASGPANDRLLSAWKHYRDEASIMGNPAFHQQKVQQWNRANPAGAPASAQGEGKPVVNGSASEMVAPGKHGVNVKQNRQQTVAAISRPPTGKPNPTVKAHVQAKAHVKARVAAKNLGVSAPKGGGSFPGADTATILPRSMADQIAGAQYDPQIREARLQQNRNAADEAQAQRDIGSWWNQVQGEQKTAATRDQAAGAAGRSDVSNLVQSLQNILGGSRGAGVVGASGAADLTALAQTSQAQDQYNQDVGPILAAQRASDQTRQQAIASQNAEKLAAQLVDLQGARGQAKSKALMDVIGANNQSRQQNFQNRLALNNAALAAQSLGLDAAKTNAQLAQYGLENKMRAAALKQQSQKANPHVDWHQLQLPDRNTVISAAVKAGLAALPQGAPWDPGHVRNAALEYLRNTGGFQSARKLGYRGRVPSKQNQLEIVGALNQAIQNAGASYGRP